MRRDELHRAIAERLEPKPTIAHPDEFWYDIKSPLGWWYAHYFQGSGWRIDPVNFSEDEAASARLRRAMLSAGISIYLVGDEDGVVRLRAHISTRIGGGVFVFDGDEKTAVLLAAQRWLGIDGELELR